MTKAAKLTGFGGLLVELVGDCISGSLETGAYTSVLVLGLLPVMVQVGTEDLGRLCGDRWHEQLTYWLPWKQ